VLTQLKTYFARRDDPYAGASLENAQKLGSVLWLLLVVLGTLLVPLSPPTEAIGQAGWLITAALFAVGVALVVALRRQRLASWEAMLAASYAALAGLGLMQWLAGGLNAPYNSLLLLPVLFAAAIQPPRRIAVFLVAVALAAAAPFLYDGFDANAAGQRGAALVIWCALAVMVNLLMTGVRAQRLIHAREEEDARHEARIDPLTGLRNRRAFDETLGRAVERARRDRTPLTLAMVDVVNFKEVNDRWGYAAGDECLRTIAAALRGALREPDLCFRWGGDEFALVLSGAGADQVAGVGERIADAIAQGCPRPDQAPFRARFAAVELGDEMGPRELVERAGQALTDARAAALE